MTYDPAFQNTASCRSRITFIDGDKGILLYRGYPIEQLAEHSTFLETAYLILFGELPTRAQLEQWTRDITLHTMLHENIKKFMDGFQYDAHPMGIFLSHRRRAVDHLPRRQARSRRRGAAAADSPADRQGAEHRRLRVPAQHRPAVRLPGQRPELHRQLPEHAVQDDRAQVPAAPGARARARRAVHPARRPRAELQHERDARHRQLAGRSVFVAGRRGGGALRAAARRRQRSRAAHAEGDRLGRRNVPDVHQASQGRRRPADGVRPPRLQVVRPARPHHQADGRPGLRGDRPQPAASTSRWSSSGSRSRTSTSSAGSCTRTSTSIPG